MSSPSPKAGSPGTNRSPRRCPNGQWLTCAHFMTSPSGPISQPHHPHPRRRRGLLLPVQIFEQTGPSAPHRPASRGVGTDGRPRGSTPCADEVALAARQPMLPTVLNGSAANVGGAGAGADRLLTQEAGRFFYWMDGGEVSRWQGFRLVKGRKHVAQGKVARRHHVHGGA